MHVGGTLAEVAAAEGAVARGEHPEAPFVLVAQQSLFDPTRAPAGRHTLWAYCHVPAGSTVDMTSRIEAQIERFAPGFRDVVVARHAMTHGGVRGLQPQLRRRRHHRRRHRLAPVRNPTGRLTTSVAHAGAGVYLCSASTPPGAGVHGLCGLARGPPGALADHP